MLEKKGNSPFREVPRSVMGGREASNFLILDSSEYGPWEVNDAIKAIGEAPEPAREKEYKLILRKILKGPSSMVSALRFAEKAGITDELLRPDIRKIIEERQLHELATRGYRLDHDLRDRPDLIVPDEDPRILDAVESGLLRRLSNGDEFSKIDLGGGHGNDPIEAYAERYNIPDDFFESDKFRSAVETGLTNRIYYKIASLAWHNLEDELASFDGLSEVIEEAIQAYSEEPFNLLDPSIRKKALERTVDLLKKYSVRGENQVGNDARPYIQKAIESLESLLGKLTNPA